MFSASLERPPPFVALSYTWGNNKHERQLHVSAGHAQGPGPELSPAISFEHVVITPSLDEALRHIRRAQQSKSVTLWVDQICIDQRNTLEKNAQVAAMGTIYGRATQVLVWLGSSTPGSEDFINRMTTVGHLAREQDIERYFDPKKRTDGELWQFMSKVVGGSGPKTQTGGPDVSDDEKFETFLCGASETLFGNGGSKKEIAAQMRAWLDRPWFSKVWVLQEYSLAAKSPVFLSVTPTAEPSRGDPLSHKAAPFRLLTVALMGGCSAPLQTKEDRRPATQSCVTTRATRRLSKNWVPGCAVTAAASLVRFMKLVRSLPSPARLVHSACFPLGTFANPVAGRRSSHRVFADLGLHAYVESGGREGRHGPPAYPERDAYHAVVAQREAERERGGPWKVSRKLYHHP